MINSKILADFTISNHCLVSWCLSVTLSICLFTDSLKAFNVEHTWPKLDVGCSRILLTLAFCANSERKTPFSLKEVDCMLHPNLPAVLYF